jgi:hypothetical protein
VQWEAIMKRFHIIEVVGDVKRRPNNVIQGIAELPVRIGHVREAPPPVGRVWSAAKMGGNKLHCAAREL